VLQQQGFEAQTAQTKLGIGELVGLVEKAGVDVVSIPSLARIKTKPVNAPGALSCEQVCERFVNRIG